uniref:Uncharacterized protein n=1 Tax=Panagrolaimus superbus TaxID=310955 RepID=A0A914Z9P8_9BILA
MDTFYAWRALYRYNERLSGPLESNNIRIQLLNAGIAMREYSNIDLPLSLQLPARSRNFSLHTIGEGRIVLGVRVLASPRKRPKRAEDNILPIAITTLQSRISQTDNYVMQLVCIRTKSKRVETLEVEHNLYTGFSTDFSKFQLLANTTQAGISLIGLQRVTVGGIYFTVTGISPEIPACYQLVVKEPVVSYTAEYLAPVTIDAHYNQISGQAVMYASEIKTILQVRHKRRHLRKRSKRGGDIPVGADLVDTICLEHGSCTCSELSCSAKCLTCKRKNDGGKLTKELVTQIKAPGRFGVLATHMSSTSILFGNENYTRAVMNVGFSIDRNLIFGCAPKKMGQFILWIRACNKHSCTKLIQNKLYLLIGSEKGFFEDSVSTTDESQTNSTQLILKHYLLHDGDRLEGGVDLEDDNESHSSCHQIIKELLILRIPCK